jgi:hypothetical protein
LRTFKKSQPSLCGSIFQFFLSPTS